MKNKLIILAIILVLILPRVEYLNDGGSISFKSATYEITKVHKINEYSKTGYEDGYIINIFKKNIFTKVTYEFEEPSKEDLEHIQDIIYTNLGKYNAYSNCPSTYIDEISNRVIVSLIDDSKENIDWFKQNIIDSPYVVFTQGDPVTTFNN